MFEIVVFVAVAVIGIIILAAVFLRRARDNDPTPNRLDGGFTPDDVHSSYGDYVGFASLCVIMGVIAGSGFVSGHIRISLYLGILYLILSIRKVDVNELGAILFFGKPIDEVEPGPIAVPFLFFTLVKETRTVRQDQVPGDPELIDKTDSDTLAPGKVFPIRATHKKTDRPTDPLDRRMTTEVTAIVRYRIQKGQFVRFLQSVQNLNEARRQIRDTLESEIKKQFVKRTPSDALEQQQDIDVELKARLETLTDSWGLEIIDTQLVDIDLGSKVNKALRDIPAALLAKDARITNSEATKQEAINLGTGAASAKREMLIAEAAGREALLLAEAIGTEKLAAIAKTSEGQITLWLNTVRAGLEKSVHTIIPGGEFLGSIAGLTEVIEKVKGVKR